MFTFVIAFDKKASAQTKSPTVNAAIKKAENATGCKATIPWSQVFAKSGHIKKSCHYKAKAADIVPSNLNCGGKKGTLQDLARFREAAKGSGIVVCGPYGYGPCNKANHRGHLHIQPNPRACY